MGCALRLIHLAFHFHFLVAGHFSDRVLDSALDLVAGALPSRSIVGSSFELSYNRYTANVEAPRLCHAAATEHERKHEAPRAIDHARWGCLGRRTARHC